MNAKLKAKWLRALRGGQYKQGTRTLVDATGTRFCCLGVLADIQGFEWIDGIDGNLVPIRPNGRKALVGEGNDMLPPKHAGGLNVCEQVDLAEMNDDGGTFKKIADYIETRF